MPPRDVRTHITRAQTIIQVDDDQDAEPSKASTGWESVPCFLMNHLLGSHRIDITKPMLMKLRFPCVPNVNREELVKALVSNDMIQLSAARGKTAEVFRPKVSCSNLEAVLRHKDTNSHKKVGKSSRKRSCSTR